MGLYNDDASAIGGKTFPSNFLYNISSSAGSSSSINGQASYSGQVNGFTEYGQEAVIIVLNPEDGSVSVGGTTYYIMGSTADGQNLVLGTQTTTNYGFGFIVTSVSPSLLISNSGNAPTGALNYNTANPYAAPNPPCIVEGAMIRTPTGDVAIEHLKVGDFVLNVKGEAQPITWLGNCVVQCAGTPWSTAVSPIRIAAGAFDELTPSADLLVSPGHALAVSANSKALIPASALVNGTTITQEEVQSVRYWHIEVPEHDAIFANGLAVETFQDHGNRGMFTGGSVVRIDSGLETADQDKTSCYRRLKHGAVVGEVRLALARRAEALGWVRSKPTTPVKLIVDGEDCSAAVFGEGFARFMIHSGAKTVDMHADTFLPADIEPVAEDHRELGLCLTSVQATDGASWESIITADHHDLKRGYHDVELEGGQLIRWTKKIASLPPALWQGAEGHLFIRINFVTSAPVVWRKSADAAAA